jgi:hypothetical protein
MMGVFPFQSYRRVRGATVAGVQAGRVKSSNSVKRILRIHTIKKVDLFPGIAYREMVQGLNLQQFFLNRHFFDIFDKITTVLHLVPFLVAHPHKKAA